LEFRKGSITMRGIQVSKLLTALVALVALSCAAGTSISSRFKGEYADKSYKKLLVVGDFSDFGLQEAIESKILRSLERYSIEGVAWHNLVFPGEDPNIDSLVIKAGVDAVLILSPGESGFSQTYIPTSSSSTTEGTVAPDFAGGYKVKAKTATTTYGGYNVNKPWATFTVGLFDSATGEMVWVAVGRTGGNAFANWKTVVRSMGGKTVVKLAQDGMIGTSAAP
jgi:hypothetical protein